MANTMKQTNVDMSSKMFPKQQYTRLRDLCPEDKLRIASLIAEMAKLNEENQEIVKRLQADRQKYNSKICKLQGQNEFILKEKEVTQRQYIQCHTLLFKYQEEIAEKQERLNKSIHKLLLPFQIPPVENRLRRKHFTVNLSDSSTSSDSLESSDCESRHHQKPRMLFHQKLLVKEKYNPQKALKTMDRLKSYSVYKKDLTEIPSANAEAISGIIVNEQISNDKTILTPPPSSEDSGIAPIRQSDDSFKDSTENLIRNFNRQHQETNFKLVKNTPIQPSNGKLTKYDFNRSNSEVDVRWKAGTFQNEMEKNSKNSHDDDDDHLNFYDNCRAVKPQENPEIVFHQEMPQSPRLSLCPTTNVSQSPSRYIAENHCCNESSIMHKVKISKGHEILRKSSDDQLSPQKLKPKDFLCSSHPPLPVYNSNTQQCVQKCKALKNNDENSSTPAVGPYTNHLQTTPHILSHNTQQQTTSTLNQNRAYKILLLQKQQQKLKEQEKYLQQRRKSLLKKQLACAKKLQTYKHCQIKVPVGTHDEVTDIPLVNDITSLKNTQDLFLQQRDLKLSQRDYKNSQQNEALTLSNTFGHNGMLRHNVTVECNAMLKAYSDYERLQHKTTEFHTPELFVSEDNQNKHVNNPLCLPDTSNTFSKVYQEDSLRPASVILSKPVDTYQRNREFRQGTLDDEDFLCLENFATLTLNKQAKEDQRFDKKRLKENDDIKTSEMTHQSTGEEFGTNKNTLPVQLLNGLLGSQQFNNQKKDPRSGCQKCLAAKPGNLHTLGLFNDEDPDLILTEEKLLQDIFFIK